jgi:hypothetical protein
MPIYKKPSQAQIDVNRSEDAERKASRLLLVIGLLVILVPGCGALVLGLVNGAMKSTSIFQEAVAKAGANSKVVEALGTPIDTGYLPSGSVHEAIHEGKREGQAAMRIELIGPKGEGSLEVEASQHDGPWQYRRLYFISDRGVGVNLIGH